MPLRPISTDYAGNRRGLFWLALKTSVLTVLTLGFYRFWMKTRLRRYYWSAIRPGGQPLEYTGTGVEKLMGFLVAVTFLAFYIGIFNLLLMFASFAVLNDNFAAYFLSFAGVIPIFFYARYRARRYILARTRWRGLRFGVEPAAWSYAWRAMLHWLLTILTLGLLLPRQMFLLERFRVNRTWFGEQRFTQEGRWQMLLPAAKHYYIGIGLTGIAAIAGFGNEVFLTLLLISLPWLVIGFVHLRVNAFRIMADHKRLGDHLTFSADPQTSKVVGIYLLGHFLTSTVTSIVVFVLVFVVFFLMALVTSGEFDLDAIEALATRRSPLTQGLLIAGGMILYFSFFVFWGVLTQVFVTLPMMHHYAGSVKIKNSHSLSDVTQRPRDEMSEAEGFAEALDVGAAI